MYPVSPTPKKTIAGLPIRNIDYGSLHKSLRVSERDDVKSKLEPHFLNTLGNMCLNASAQSEKSVGKTGGYHGNAISYQDDERTKRNAKEAAYTCTLNNDRSNIPQSPVPQTRPAPHSCTPTYCGICRKNQEDMTHYGIYHQDETVDMVMGSVIDRIDHLIDRLGKGGYDKYIGDKLGKGEKGVNKVNKDVGFMLPCEACAIRSKKRYSEVSCQTEDFEPVNNQDMEVEDLDLTDQPSIDEAPKSEAGSPAKPPSSPSKDNQSPTLKQISQDISFEKGGGKFVSKIPIYKTQRTVNIAGGLIHLNKHPDIVPPPASIADIARTDSQSSLLAYTIFSAPPGEVIQDPLTVRVAVGVGGESGEKDVRKDGEEIESLARDQEDPPLQKEMQEMKCLSGQLTKSELTSVFTETDDESNFSSDDEFSLDIDKEEAEAVPSEVQEYQIAASQRLAMPEPGTVETVHFRMLPYKNLVVWGHKKFVGTLPTRVALKSNYDLSYHITVFKSMTSDRIELRLKKLKELVTTKGKGGLSPRRGPTGRTIDSSKLANVMVVDIARYSRMKKCRGGTDMRIPIVNLRDGYNNKLFLSERVSEILLSRSPRLRFALELAKSNRAHWKANAKDLASNCRPYQNATFYGGKSHTQFYLAEMKKFVSKPLHSRCIVYYADIYEDNTKDHVKSKTFVSCLGNIAGKDSKALPTMNLEERIKEHFRAGQKLHDPKINIFNVALQNPILGLDEPGKYLPRKEAMKGSTEITKCPNLLFVPLDFGFSSWSKPTTPDHLSPLKQAYSDVFCSNGPAGYNV